MKIEPVYLLAPEPEKPPDRRSFLALAVAGTIGVCLGWTGGFVQGRSTSVPEDTDDRQPVPPRPDAEWLDWARPHALGETTDAEFLEEWPAYLQIVRLHGVEERWLWDGASRLAVLALEADSDDQRARRISLRLVSLLDVLEAHAPDRLLRLAPRLRTRAK